MSDIYNDLENYEQEEIIKELRNENKELKCKLEEYASTLDTLQKDFDKLSAEYKKLELNYSSLLKTARAEIERKTTIITNLNVEKDKLVISALQNKGRAHTNHQNKTQNKKNTKPQVKGVSSDTGKNVTSASNETDKSAPGAVHNDRKNTVDKITCLRSSSSTTTNTSTKVRSDSVEKGQNLKTSDNGRDKDKDKAKSKESRQNHLDELIGEKGKVEVKKIFNRRKSMPLFNRGDIKFSSDEEQDDNSRDYCERDRFKRKASSRDFNERKYDNDWTSRSGPNVFDTAKLDDKYASYHDSSRDYRKNNSRQNDDRHRIKDNRDKYNLSQRSKRHYSPNKSRYNSRKEYSNDRPHRSDTVSHRILESPPPDKYNQYRRSRDVDRLSFQNEETFKHKIHDVMEEPACKRMRTESLNRQSDEHINLQPDRDIGIPTAGTQPPQYSYLFLQSPDHVHLENNPPVHQVKEIMGTAATDLDDPRLKSKKYVLKTHKDKVTLSTVVGRDVEMKLVDETTWVKDKLQKMPTPLREKPQTTEDLIKNIYMDIDNPILNLSLESGEIVCSEDDLRINNFNKNLVEDNTGVANLGAANSSVATTGEVKAAVKDPSLASIDVPCTGVASTSLVNTGVVNTSVGNNGKDTTDLTDKEVATTGVATLKTRLKCNKPVHDNIQSEHQIQGNKIQIPDPTDNKQTCPSLSKKYIIPKVNKPNTHKPLEDVITKPVHDNIQSEHQIQGNKIQIPDPTDLQTCPSLSKKYIIPKVNKPNTHKPLEDVITNIMHKLDKKDQCQKDIADKETKVKEKTTRKEFDIHNPLKLFSSAKQICENKSNDQLVDVRREKYSPEKVTSSARDTVEGDLELSDETSDCPEFIDKIRCSKEKNAMTDISHKEAHNSEKQCSDSIDKRREDLKHGIETIFNNNQTNIPVTLPEVKLQGSKTCNDGLKDKTKDMKSKLCDLFGDSSSLITPDDLGIADPPITNQIMNDYVPLFDTQDAIDLNVEEMEKVQTRSLKKESDKSAVNNEHQNTKHDKKQKSKTNKTNNEGKKKPKNNSDKKSAVEPVIRNDDAEVLNAEPNVVKTIIISTGVQNNCNSEDLVVNNGKESQSLDILPKIDNNVPNYSSLPCLKALATSTPHKLNQPANQLLTQVEPTISAPEISCNSSNNLATKDNSTISNTKSSDTTAQHSLDVPDVRIIIKRRRKGKAAPS